MKKLLRVFIIAVLTAALIAGVLIFERKQIVKAAVTIGATNILGAPVRMDSVSLSESGASFSMEGFRVYNPGGFKKGVLADIPVIDAEYDGSDVLSENVLRLKKLKIKVKTLLVIRNKEGVLNVDELRIVKDVMHTKMHIDTLILTADKVVYKDYTKGEAPTVEGFDINIKQKVYKDITTAEQLGRKILSEILAKTTIKDAAVLGAAAIAGLALAPPIGLPIAAAILIGGNDSVKADFSKSYGDVYNAARDAIKGIGTLKYENKTKGVLSGSVKGGSIKIKMKKMGNKIHVTVSGRKIVMPRPQIASGVLFEMSRKLEGAEVAS